MPPISGKSPRRNLRLSRVESGLVTGLVAATLAACGPRDARVGAVFLPTPDGSATDTGSPIFSTEMASNGGLWDVVTSLPGAQVIFGATSAESVTRDGKAARLVFPGDPSNTDTTHTGSDANTGIESTQSFRYGTLRARVLWAACAPHEEIASAASLYFSDGADKNGNGLRDVHELDFQVLCGTPSFIVLSAWSDYQQDAQGQETFLKHSHAVDTATGDVYDTPVASEPAFVKTGQVAELVQPGFPDPATYYDLGITWQPDHVRFFMMLEGREITLWDLTDAAYLPRVPLTLIFNLWHPATHWLPSRTPADLPAHDSVFLVDWAAWFSESGA